VFFSGWIEWGEKALSRHFLSGGNIGSKIKIAIIKFIRGTTSGFSQIRGFRIHQNKVAFLRPFRNILWLPVGFVGLLISSTFY
jgi:hypothetical protein